MRCFAKQTTRNVISLGTTVSVTTLVLQILLCVVAVIWTICFSRHPASTLIRRRRFEKALNRVPLNHFLFLLRVFVEILFIVHNGRVHESLALLHVKDIFVDRVLGDEFDDGDFFRLSDPVAAIFRLT